MTAATGVRALLADGRVVTIRATGTGDADEVLSLHKRLSEHDRYLRELGGLRRRVRSSPG